MKAKTKVKSSSLTVIQSLQQEYWQGLKDFFKKNNSGVIITNVQARHYSTISVGKTGFDVAAAVSSRDKTICIWLNIRGKNAKENYDSLHSKYYNSSKSEIYNNLIWDKMDGKVQSAVILRNPMDFTDKSDWPNQFKWFQTYLEKFSNFFEPKVNAL